MILGIKYCVPRYPAGDTFTLAPSYPCEYGFTPTQTEVTIAGADVMEVNFTARRLTYAIYGVVTAGGDVPLSGVVVNLKESIVGDTGLIASTTTDSSGRYQFAMLENGFYRVSTEENCFAETGLEMVVVFCGNKEVNFECRIFSETEKSEEKKSILRELNRLKGIDNKGRQADNGDMNATADKDNPSALSLQPSSRTEASAPEYLFYHWDHLGTTRLITTTPTAANPTGVVSRHDYEPFGVEIAPYPTGDEDTVKNTHQYTGHERDKATGYDYMHFRYYGSNIGRFMKPDNVRGKLTNPQSFNLYAYVTGNPVSFNDPTGHTGDLGQFMSDLRKVAGPKGPDTEGSPSPQGDTGKEEKPLQGAAVSLGAQATSDAIVRTGYKEAVSKLPEGGNAARDALVTSARNMTTPAGAAIAETMKPSSTLGSNLTGTVTKTNAEVNAAMGVAGKAGPLMLGAGAAISAINVAKAPEGQKCKTMAKESGAWLGAIAFGAEGAKGGALIGAFFTPAGAAIGAVIGGVGGGIIGALVGEKAGENVYDATTPQ